MASSAHANPLHNYPHMPESDLLSSGDKRAGESPGGVCAEPRPSPASGLAPPPPPQLGPNKGRVPERRD